MRPRMPVLAVLLAVALFAPLSTVTAAQVPGVTARAGDELRPYRPGQEPLGHRWEAWVGRYSEWIQEIPIGRNPAVHADSPRNCEVQYGAVLMGFSGTAEAGCAVPRDHPVLLSYLGWSCSTAEGNGRSWRALRTCARTNHRTANSDVGVRVTLDGTRLSHPRRWTYDSTRRVVTLPENNILNVRAGNTRSLAKFVVLMLRPLNPGVHVVRVRLEEGGEASVFRYGLTVV